MKNSEVKNKLKHKYGTLKTDLFIWYFNPKIFQDGRLLKHKYRIYSHGGMQQGG